MPHLVRTFQGDHWTPELNERLAVHVTSIMPIKATAEIMSRIADPRLYPQTLRAVLELPGELDAADVDCATLALTAVGGRKLSSPVPFLAGRCEIASVNGNDRDDLTARLPSVRGNFGRTRIRAEDNPFPCAWPSGHLGLLRVLLVVLVANAITFVTNISFSSVATNARVGVGGTYFIISRSLGLELGGAIGVPLFLSKALSVTLHAYGLTESFRFVWPNLPLIPVALVIVFAVGGPAAAGADRALRAHPLQNNPEWRHARVEFTSMASNELMKVRTEAHLARLIPEIRVDAVSRVVLKPKDLRCRSSSSGTAPTPRWSSSAWPHLSPGMSKPQQSGSSSWLETCRLSSSSRTPPCSSASCSTSRMTRRHRLPNWQRSCLAAGTAGRCATMAEC